MRMDRRVAALHPDDPRRLRAELERSKAQREVATNVVRSIWRRYEEDVRNQYDEYVSRYVLEAELRVIFAALGADPDTEIAIAAEEARMLEEGRRALRAEMDEAANAEAEAAQGAAWQADDQRVRWAIADMEERAEWEQAYADHQAAEEERRRDRQEEPPF